MEKDDSITSAGAEADSEPKAEVTTSSSNDTKPNVVGSQCTPMSLEKANQLIQSAFEENILILHT